ncbi:MAG TPA: hypothetical protein VE442_09055 [Jatrophihabitans sp.]|nr:hypothetical protein [Jatrophihabitans sp.]
MVGRPGRERTVSRASTRGRVAVHVLLVATAVVSLILEPEITLHVLVGLVFVAFVAVHLAQRRQVAQRLAGHLSAPWRLHRAPVRLAVADAMLLVVTLAMLGSGLWDWLDGRPTRIRWHAISGVLLTGYLIAHTIRRRRRLTSSRSAERVRADQGT